MFFQQHDDLTYACFSNLTACRDIFHAIFTRPQNMHGNDNDPEIKIGPAGLSKKESETINPGKTARCLGASRLVFLNQVHGSSVSVIQSTQQAVSAQTSPPKADAVISCLPETGLVIQTADCQALLLHDPVRLVAANIHAGWRGSVADVIGECIKTMEKKFGTRSSDLLAGIGPSLGPCCAEFVNFEAEIPKKFWKYKDCRHRFDFWQISTDQLQAAGVRSKNIEPANICTLCNPHLFFSYRKNKTARRFYSVIGLKSPV